MQRAIFSKTTPGHIFIRNFQKYSDTDVVVGWLKEGNGIQKTDIVLKIRPIDSILFSFPEQKGGGFHRIKVEYEAIQFTLKIEKQSNDVSNDITIYFDIFKNGN